MTTLDDTVSYVLANPLEAVGHCALVDRVTEEYGQQHARGTLLGFVIAAPESDGVRLAFAEWCSRNGEEKRGEFIRISIAAVRLNPDDFADAGIAMDRQLELDERVAYLWDKCGIGETFDICGLCSRLWWEKCESESDICIVWRGFVESVVCTSARWLAHGDAIRREHPVTRVRLTDSPPLDDTQFAFAVRGGRNPHYSPRWPGVEFELPSLLANTGWDVRPDANPIDDLRSWRERLDPVRFPGEPL